MPLRILVLIVIVLVVVPVERALAQFGDRRAPVVQQVSAAGGRVHGVVRDDLGQAIRGASVVALGTAQALVRSDGDGRFSLSLPAGEYMLRASRSGYISSSREMVRVQTNGLLEQNITLTRQGLVDQRVNLTSTTGVASSQPDGAEKTSDHAHNEAAWRLRHVTRTVLRDEAPATGGAAGERNGKPAPSFFDWAIEGSARAASSFFTDTDFRGEVNFLTTSSVPASNGWLPAGMPRGIAYLAVSAPVGVFGDWSVRGAITAGDLSSWVFVGEYEANELSDHAFTVGMSFSAQGYPADRRRLGSVSASQARNVGGLYGFDRWRIRPGVELDYGLRVDRYDYIQTPRLISPRVGARVMVLPGTFVTTRASERTIAPGADEFLPPASSAPWLPPERTFSSLSFRSPLKAERVRHLEFGLEHEFGDADAPNTIGVRRYRQFSFDQVTTLFGLSEERSGHYFVASPGDVEIDGWAVRLGGRVTPRVRGNVEYAINTAEWSNSWQMRAIRRFAPSAVRAARERMHDVTASVDASIPGTSTGVSMAYRMNSAFSAVNRSGRLPIADGRFDLQVRQALPYRPLRGSTLELLFAVRSLFRDLRETGSIYDELLTVAPPVRWTGGVQVRF
jgi:hypothetical protein